jgi:hypothetical protein
MRRIDCTQIGMAVPIEPELRWLAADGLPPRHGRALLRLLEAVSRSDSLRAASPAFRIAMRGACWGPERVRSARRSSSCSAAAERA